jgi:HEXXH motif-containing protein
MTGTILSAEAASYFASPILPGDSHSAEFMMGEYVRALLEIAFAECDGMLRGLSPSLVETRHELTNAMLPSSVMWRPSIARLERELVKSTSPSNVWDALAPLIVELGAEGLLREAEIQVDMAQVFYWGTVKLPKADRIAFQYTNGGAEIHLSHLGKDMTAISVQRSADGIWMTEQAENVPIIWLDRYPIALHCMESGIAYRIPPDRRLLPDALAIITPVIAEAARVLADHSPHFLPWVGNAMRNIVPLDASDGIRMSATVEEFPGLTFLSFPTTAVELAETLVHETSHQYYFAAQRLASVHDGSDTKLYYSPIKDRGRSIDLILFAFHAFGNAALFHRELARADSRFDRINGRSIKQSLERLSALHSHLGETRALTPMGQVLWRPLANQLF